MPSSLRVKGWCSGLCFWVASAQAVAYPKAVGAERPCSASAVRCASQGRDHQWMYDWLILHRS